VSLGGSLAKTDAEVQAGLSKLTQGTCVSVDWLNHLVVVNIGGGQVSMPMVSRAPFPNDKVWIGFLGEQPVCLGSVPKAATGTVAGTATLGKISVTGDDGASYRLPFLGAEPVEGERVVIDWDSSGIILSGAMSSEPNVELVYAPPGQGGGIQERTFLPTDSANFRSGAYQNNGVEISDTRSGFYYYGTSLADSIPDGATVLEARIYLNQEWDNVPGTASRMGTHTNGSRGGEPTLSGALSVPGDSRWVDLMAFIGALQSGAALGVGFYAAVGWRKYSPAGASGQIYVKWQ
jgi:hypothetical protein